jgi:hypothetical protein
MQDRVEASREAHNGAAAPHANGLLRVAFLGIHPFLFAAASVLRLHASNLRETYFSDAVPALAAVLVVALVLFLALGAIIRSFGAKAAVLASIAIVAGLFYVDLVDAANRYLGLDLSPVAALPVMLAAFAVIVGALAWLRVDLTPANAVLNCIAVAMLISPAWKAASHAWSVGGSPLSAEAADEGIVTASAAPPGAGSAGTQADRPDIYYFIFDRYGSQSVLAEHYGFDNSELIGFLEEQGFYVASDSRANYLKTAHSLASTFHMDYLDFLREDPRSEAGVWHPIYDMVRNHRVGRFLKSTGYEFIQIGAWWAPTQYSPLADENYDFGFTEFDDRYLEKTVVPALLEAVAPESPYARHLQWDNGQCQRVPKQVEKVKEIAQRNQPTFTFVHILVPHAPYVFGPDGRCLRPEEILMRPQPKAYVEQVQYAN